jgi:hypothetical protein
MTVTPSNLTNPADDRTAAAPQRSGLWLLGLILSLAGPVAYMAFLGNAMLRATGAAGFALLIAGTLVGWIALRRDKRRRVRIAAGFDVFLLMLYTVGLFWLSALPGSPAFAALAAPPDFTLPDETNHPTKLSDAYAAGPVLLVFYRGFW